ncbi:MAG: response regulator [Candidatus Peregrinibacteria bacterium]|nr:response regulator [Candidatus Peregrinibacteria bacterium]
MAKGNVLIAEDDPVLRNLYVKKFSVAGYTIRTAADGEEALAALHQQFPDVLVLDIHMPKMDGFQVLEKVPKESRTFPVVLLTNFEEERYRTRGKELGAEGYFVKKDMTIRSLIDMVESLLAQKKSS